MYNLFSVLYFGLFALESFTPNFLFMLGHMERFWNFSTSFRVETYKQLRISHVSQQKTFDE